LSSIFPVATALFPFFSFCASTSTPSTPYRPCLSFVVLFGVSPTAASPALRFVPPYTRISSSTSDTSLTSAGFQIHSTITATFLVLTAGLRRTKIQETEFARGVSEYRPLQVSTHQKSCQPAVKAFRARHEKLVPLPVSVLAFVLDGRRCNTFGVYLLSIDHPADSSVLSSRHPSLSAQATSRATRCCSDPSLSIFLHDDAF